jgi:hypothetical protein
MSKASFVRVVAAFVAAINITHDLDGDGLAAAPAEWVHLPGATGSTITIEDMSGHSVILTSTDQVTSWRVTFRKITAASAAFQFGTGPGPMGQGAKGDQGGVGDPGLVSMVLPITTAIPAGTDLPEIVLGTNGGGSNLTIPALGISFEGGALTASDTNYLTITFLIRDAANANPVTLGTLVTKITGGTGNWAGTVGTKQQVTVTGGGGVVTLPPGYSLRMKTAHSGSGAILPVGFFEALTS